MEAPEDLCCAFYREIGVRAEVTRLGADGGIDVRLFQDETDPTRTTAVVSARPGTSRSASNRCASCAV